MGRFSWLSVQMSPVFVAGYDRHVDCLTDLERGSDSDQRVDCFGVYPQVLPIAADWVTSDDGLKLRERMPRRSTADIIYLGWNLHLCVYLFIYSYFLIYL